ncbi:MAG: RES family NAD+ phosphorylase [Thermomicrobiales bacterium]|nr:RES family NAD+ phosphorylase [Thermomicrobiales bacterium]
MTVLSDLQQYGITLDEAVWRVVSKRFSPMAAPPRSLQGESRFDDPLIGTDDGGSGYSVLYAATEPKAAFLEVLYQFRPAIQAVAGFAADMVLDVAERDRFLDPEGQVMPSWMRQTQLSSAQLMPDAPLFDLTDPGAIQMLRLFLAPSLIALGVADLDFGEVLGTNRQLTRAISRWLWSLSASSGIPLFSGIRYRSRLDPSCFCLALFEDRFRVIGEVSTETITTHSAGFAEAAEILRLRIPG